MNARVRLREAIPAALKTAEGFFRIFQPFLEAIRRHCVIAQSVHCPAGQKRAVSRLSNLKQAFVQML